jgi:hypothetical protein
MGRSQTYSWFIVAGCSGSSFWDKRMERARLEERFRMPFVTLFPRRGSLVCIMRLCRLSGLRPLWRRLARLRCWTSARWDDDDFRACRTLPQDQNDNDSNRDPKDHQKNAIDQGSSLHISKLHVTTVRQLDSGTSCRQLHSQLVSYSGYTIHYSSYRTLPEAHPEAQNHTLPFLLVGPRQASLRPGQSRPSGSPMRCSRTCNPCHTIAGHLSPKAR